MNMITEDYVSFEIAKLLKEKGFDENTNCYYIEGSVDKNLCYSPIRQNHNKKITNNEFDINIDITSSKISAPTLQMVMKWLREVHSIIIIVRLFNSAKHFYLGEPNQFTVDIATTTMSSQEGNIRTVYSTYEEACEAAIKYCLENLI